MRVEGYGIFSGAPLSSQSVLCIDHRFHPSRASIFRRLRASRALHSAGFGVDNVGAKVLHNSSDGHHGHHGHRHHNHNFDGHHHHRNQHHHVGRDGLIAIMGLFS